MEKVGKESILFEWYEDRLKKRFCKRCHRVVKKLNGNPCGDVLLHPGGLLMCPGCGWDIGRKTLKREDEKEDI